ncbi:MAG: ankyrin repeat domain-containing protein [Victivallales bacterium]|nr:ankyrin repeat domain-containing protein [Victivallales bacterium]
MNDSSGGMRDVSFNTVPVDSSIYNKLRMTVLTMDPAGIGLSPETDGPVWGILAEMGISGAVASLLMVRDGTVSLYFSKGGGIVGGGAHDDVLDAADNCLSHAGACLAHAKPAYMFPTPEDDKVVFYLLAFGEIFTVGVEVQELERGAHPLSELFRMAQEVLSRLESYSTGSAQGVDGFLFPVDKKVNQDMLVKAVNDGDVEKIRSLIDQGAEPNSPGDEGLTPLMAAAYNGDDGIVALLLDAGADTELKDISGYTALMYACLQGNYACAKLLVDCGADINARDNDNSTPLMFAVQGDAWNTIVKMLVAEGADPSFAGNHGMSAIDFAIQNGREDTLMILQKSL